MLGVDPLPPPGVKREVAAVEKAAGEENTASEATEPDTKRPRIAEEQQEP